MAAPVIINPPSSATDSIYPNNVFPKNYVNGLNLTWTAVDQVTVSAGVCKDDANSIDITLAADTLMDIDSDLDTGSEASSTWYYIWLFYSPELDTTSLKFSVQYPGSGTDPTAPGATYTKKRWIGSVRNDSGGDFLEFHQSGEGVDRYYRYDTKYSVLSNGTTVPGPTDIDISDYVPVTGLNVFGEGQQTATTNGSVFLQAKGQNSNITLFPVASGNNPKGVFLELPAGTDQTWQYERVSGTTIAVYVYIHSYTESL